MATIKSEVLQFTSMVGARANDALDAISNTFNSIKSIFIFKG